MTQRFMKFYPPLDRPTMLILGTGRSGTTWLASMLARKFRHRLLFEPVKPGKVIGAEAIADRYLDPDALPDEVVQFCIRALNDKINNDWIAQASNRRLGMHRWRFWPKLRIVKDIRTNLFVPSYRAIFGDELPIIILVRHPGAVVESFQRVQFPWAFEVDTLLEQHGVEERYGIPINQLRGYSGHKIGQLMIRWIIENLYLLRYGESYGVQLVYYEHLLQDPVREIEALGKQLGISLPKNLEQLVSRPSHTTHHRSPVFEKSNSGTGWLERLRSEDLMLIDEMLRIVEFDYPALWV